MTEYHNQAKSSVAPVESRRKMANPATFPPKIWTGFAIAAIFLSGGLAACSNRTAQSPSTTETTTTIATSPAVSSPNSSPSPSTIETTPTTTPAVSSPNSSSQTMSVGVASPAENRDFLTMMTAHHQMATQMSQMVLKTTKSPEIKTLAQSIVKTQTAEIGQMQQWYQSWYKSNL